MIKAIKIFISVYPVWYRVLVFICIPISVIGIGSVMLISGGEISAYDWGLLTAFSSMGLIYAELFGEFVRNFAIVDVLRKVIGYPIIFGISQLLVMIVNPDAANVLDGVMLGFIFAVSIIVGVWIIRVTKAIGLRFISILSTGSIMTTLGIPFLFVHDPILKAVIGIVSVILTLLFAFLSARSVIRSSKEDYFDEKN